MSRPLRIEFPGAVYHVTSRGDRREAIYRDDADRVAQLEVIAQAADRFDATVLAYCLMGNHYHLVLHTREANLSRLMRHAESGSGLAFPLIFQVVSPHEPPPSHRIPRRRLPRHVAR